VGLPHLTVDRLLSGSCCVSAHLSRPPPMSTIPQYAAVPLTTEGSRAADGVGGGSSAGSGSGSSAPRRPVFDTTTPYPDTELRSPLKDGFGAWHVIELITRAGRRWMLSALGYVRRGGGQEAENVVPSLPLLCALNLGPNFAVEDWDLMEQLFEHGVHNHLRASGKDSAVLVAEPSLAPRSDRYPTRLFPLVDLTAHLTTAAVQRSWCSRVL
jgi:hypothetical protein